MKKDIVKAILSKDYAKANNIFGSILVEKLEEEFEAKKKELVQENWGTAAKIAGGVLSGGAALYFGGRKVHAKFAKTVSHRAYGNIVKKMQKLVNDRSKAETDFVQIFFSKDEKKSRHVPKYEARFVTEFMKDKGALGGTKINVGTQFGSSESYLQALHNTDPDNGIIGHYINNDPDSRILADYVQSHSSYKAKTEQRNSNINRSRHDISIFNSPIQQDPTTADVDEPYVSPLDEALSKYRNISEFNINYGHAAYTDPDWNNQDIENQEGVYDTAKETATSVKSGVGTVVKAVADKKNKERQQMISDLDKLFVKLKDANKENDEFEIRKIKSKIVKIQDQAQKKGYDDIETYIQDKNKELVTSEREDDQAALVNLQTTLTSSDKSPAEKAKAQKQFDAIKDKYKDDPDMQDQIDVADQTIDHKNTNALLKIWDNDLSKIQQRVSQIQPQNMQITEANNIEIALNNLEDQLQEYTNGEDENRKFQLKQVRDKLKNSITSFYLTVYNDPISTDDEKATALANIKDNDNFNKQYSDIQQKLDKIQTLKNAIPGILQKNMKNLKPSTVFNSLSPHIWLDFPSIQDKSAQVCLDREDALAIGLWLYKGLSNISYTKRKEEFNKQFDIDDSGKPPTMADAANWFTNWARKKPYDTKYIQAAENSWPDPEISGLKSFDDWKNGLRSNGYRMLRNRGMVHITKQQTGEY